MDDLEVPPILGNTHMARIIYKYIYIIPSLITRILNTNINHQFQEPNRRTPKTIRFLMSAVLHVFLYMLRRFEKHRNSMCLFNVFHVFRFRFVSNNIMRSSFELCFARVMKNFWIFTPILQNPRVLSKCDFFGACIDTCR